MTTPTEPDATTRFMTNLLGLADMVFLVFDNVEKAGIKLDVDMKLLRSARMNIHPSSEHTQVVELFIENTYTHWDSIHDGDLDYVIKFSRVFFDIVLTKINEAARSNFMASMMKNMIPADMTADKCSRMLDDCLNARDVNRKLIIDDQTREYISMYLKSLIRISITYIHVYCDMYMKDGNATYRNKYLVPGLDINHHAAKWGVKRFL